MCELKWELTLSADYKHWLYFSILVIQMEIGFNVKLKIFKRSLFMYMQINNKQIKMNKKK